MADVPTPNAAFADRYVIERELGHGAMATVYLARDQKLDRLVALKVLTPELALGVRTERFLREIQVTARLNHPHILTLIDSGAAQGILYYVMPYVAGESLRDRLKREPQLPLTDALQIAGDVARALDHAHRQGVVHRDIKPENILLHEGHAVVMDFGIARALTVSGADDTDAVTQTGVTVGTPLYMSPEQARPGETTVDARSDVYSLGCVVYEMLAGHPPYAGSSAQEVLARHALDPVPALAAARPGTPAGVSQALTRALAKRPADRYPSAGAFTAALTRPGSVERPRRTVRRLVYASGLAALVAGSALLARVFPGGAPPEQSVVVLPFANLTGDPENEYLSEGITEEVITALAQLEGLRVPARTSAFAFKGTNTDTREIGRQLNVATVLEGSVQRSGDWLRVSAQLINVADGFHLWSQTYDRELRDMFVVQNEIASGIATALKLRLPGGAATPRARRHSANVEAYQLYLKGRFFWNKRDREGLTKAVEFFQAAVAKDSGYALAYSGLADSYVLLFSLQYLDRAATHASARAAALKAVAQDPMLAEAHTSLARILQEYDWNWRRAEQEYLRAIELDATYPTAHHWYSVLLREIGRSDQAVSEATRAQALDPLAPILAAALGNALVRAHRYPEALNTFREVKRLDPHFSPYRMFESGAYLGLGMYEEAIATQQEKVDALAREYPERGASRSLAVLGYAYARAGRRAEAMQIFEDLQERAKTQRVSHLLAIVHLGLGEHDQALAAIEKAYADGSLRYRALSLPLWDPVRSDPRFFRLLRAMGLEGLAELP